MPVLSSIDSAGHNSWNSSSTHYSESLRPGSRKGSARLHPCKRENEFDAIEEEGISGDDNRNGIRRRCYILAFIVEFFFLFSFFAPVLCGLLPTYIENEKREKKKKVLDGI
ncbi:hypothetical protein R6Q59_031678 [Mikania micrantha]